MDPVTKDRVGDDGKMRIWDIPSGKWKRAYAVDSREQLKMGTASMRGPDTELVGPGGRFMCCAEEVEGYLNQKGYSEVKKKATKSKPALPHTPPQKNGEGGEGANAGDGGEKDADDDYDYEGYTVVELRECVQHLALTGVGTKKSEIIDALSAVEDQTVGVAFLSAMNSD